MKQGMTIDGLEQEVARQQKMKLDLVAPLAKIEGIYTKDAYHQLVVGDRTFSINDIAHSQIAQFLDVPQAYYRRMMQTHPYLWEHTVNAWLRLDDGKNAKRLVRTIGGTCRAFLSDRFRPLEHIDMLASALPAMRKLRLRIMSSQITETRLYLKATTEEGWEKVQVARAAKGEHAKFDWFSPALCLSNSEVGHGALSLEIGMFTSGCTNLMWMPEKSLRKYHIGKRLADVSDDVFAVLTDETKRATDDALWMQFRDVINNALNRDTFRAMFETVQKAKDDVIPEENVIEAVEFASKKLTLDETESKATLRHLLKTNDLSRHGLLQAITRTAEDLVDYDRATELERIGGRVLELGKGEWRQIAEAA